MASLEEVVNYSQQNVEQSLANAEVFISELQEAINWETIWNFNNNVSLDAQILSGSNAYIQTTNAPTFLFGETTLNNVPNVLNPAPVIAGLNAVTIPSFESVAPILNMPMRPDATLPDTPTGIPEFNAPSLPVKPTFTLPTLPEFNPVSIPSPPNIEIPFWNETAPQDDLLLPTAQFTWGETAYTSELLDSATSLLQSDLDSGGYGINPDDEQALWERARDREMTNADTAIQELQRNMASRGFSFPQGAMLAGMQKIQQQSRANVSSVGRDIALKRSELLLQARQFAITTGLNAEQFLISYHAGFAERALNAAKFTFEAGTILFDMQVKRFNAKLQLYQTTAQVYETQIRAALAKADIFRTQLESARLTVNINESVVDLYRAQLSGIESVINIYRTEMEAANINASIEKLKLEAFRERIEMYSTQVRAKSEEFRMYETAIRGELAKVDVYRTEVDAFNSRVNAAKTQKEVSRLDAQHQIEVGELRIKELGANLERFKSILSSNIQGAETILRKHGIDVEVWRTNVDVAIKEANFELEKWQKELNTELDLMRVKIQERTAIANSDHQIATEGITAAGRGLDMYQKIIESAQNSLSAITTLAE